MQSILIVEGTDASKTVSDRKLYRALHPGFDRVSIVPGGGRGECIKLLEVLGSALQAFSPAIKAVALLDRDLSSDTAPAGVTYIPVSMIENFLLDPDAIWESMQSVIEKTAFNAVEDISAALDVLLDGMTDDEVAWRTLRALGVMVFRPHKPLDGIPGEAEAFGAELRERYSSEAVRTAKEHSAGHVAKVKEVNQRREHFDGKAVLSEFLKRHLHGTVWRAAFLCTRPPGTPDAGRRLSSSLMSSLELPWLRFMVPKYLELASPLKGLSCSGWWRRGDSNP